MPDITRRKPAAGPGAAGAASVAMDYKLYIMRHGKAAAAGPPYSDDAKRPLTARGIKDLQKIGKGLIRSGAVLEWVVSSPLVRARETAQIVAESFAPAAPVDFTEALSPGGTPEALLAFLGKQAPRKSTLLVGHEPGLSELACRLLGANVDAGLAFKKGGCCLITFPDAPRISTGRLRWWLSPRLLRKLA